MIVQAKRNVLEGQKNEMIKKNQNIERDVKLCHRKKLTSSNEKIISEKIIKSNNEKTKYSLRGERIAVANA